MRYLGFYVLFLSVFLVTSCASDVLNDTGDILKNLAKDTEKEKELKDASKVVMVVYAYEDININEDNEPTPVNFLVLEMSNDTLLETLDYETLSGDIKKALGESYIHHEEYIVEPGKFIYIEEFPLKKGTRYLGVLSAYRSIDSTIWRTSLKVSDTGEEYTIHTALKKDSVSMEIQ